MPTTPPPLPPDALPPEIDFARRSSVVNIVLIIGSIAFSLWTSFGADSQRERLLPWFISDFPANSPGWLLEVRHGEVWRLFTPAFLHFSVAHLGFNMLNLMGLGNVLEKRLGSGHYLVFALAVGVCSNLGQYFIGGSIFFGGMSGIVYGLIGYIWLRGHFDGTFGLALPQQAVVFALIWFVLCLTGAMGPIANLAHGVGLVMGAIWGVVDGRAAMQRARAVGITPPYVDPA